MPPPTDAKLELFFISGRRGDEVARTESVDDSSEQWGSFEWVVPGEPSEDCLVSVEDYFLEHVQVSPQTFAIRAAASTEGSPPTIMVGRVACSAGRENGEGVLVLWLLLLLLRRRRLGLSRC